MSASSPRPAAPDTICDCGSPLEDAHPWNPRMCPPRPVSLQASPTPAARPTLSQDQADALLDRLHGVRRAEGRLAKFDAIKQLAEAIYVLAGWSPPEGLSVADRRLTTPVVPSGSRRDGDL
jgi:hypothetical protein